MNDKRTMLRDEIDALAQEIRRVDGENSLGAGALAEALQPFLTELQHRREAEAGSNLQKVQSADHVADAGEMVAPGGWVLVPRELTLDMEQAHYDAHAKAETVFASAQEVWAAMLAASPSSPASGVRVKALEWVQNWPIDPLTGFAKVDHINRTYTVDHDGPRFYASTNVSPSDYSGDAIGNYGTFDEAKAACQADYEARIRSALGEHP